MTTSKPALGARVGALFGALVVAALGVLLISGIAALTIAIWRAVL